MLIKICNKVIEYSFYATFLLVPWALWKDTSELFELNKMWLTWGLTIIIAGAWFTKMLLEKRVLFQRTPLDIPIVLFLLSQIISTIFSLDSHVSLWGYYSRFNGGLLSIISYVFLYYAFLSNSPSLAKVQRLMTISLISGLIVALWGLPSHFGYDPTCLLFRGTFDVSCWTADFIPTIRIFSTLGQPDWLAAYLAILIPIAIAKAISDKKEAISRNSGLLFAFGLSLIALFYIDLLYTRARSGILGIWLSLTFFFGVYMWLQRRNLKSLILNHSSLIIGLLLLITFVIGTPINQVRMLTLEGIKSVLQKPATTPSNGADAESLKQTETQKEKDLAPPHDPGGPAPRSFSEGGTESGDIRINVWKGAINAWRANPIFGTGVETFAFAYYKYKPVEHNLTSEWNFLYNKAHNEYLNYLATTGLFGLGTYLLMIGSFIFLSFKQFKIQNAKFKITIQNSKLEKDKLLTLDSNFSLLTLNFALIASYISILITNFFGFSVVITNIYLFMIPAFIFILSGMIKPEISNKKPAWQRGEQEIRGLSPFSLTGIFFILVISCFLLITLLRFWRADIAYALGYNLDRAGEYQNAYPYLHKAIELRGDELVFKDELSINDAIIAAGLLAQEPAKDQKEQTISVASALMQEAINTSNEIISKSPSNAVFWKTRVRLFHTLSQIDSRYLPKAMDAIEKASLLAPHDANIWYNLGVLYGQNNNIKKGIEALEKTIQMKPNYRDAHYALGLYYHTASLDEKAIAQMRYILDRINPNDAGALESLKNW